MRSRPLVVVVPEMPSPSRGAVTDQPSRLFRDALATRLGMPVQLVEVASHAGLFAALDGLAADVVWAPPLVAQSFVREGRAEPVAAAVRAGRTSYPAVIVGRSDGGLKLGRSKPVSLALAAPLSAGGDRVARLFLAAVGQRIREQRHLGSHDAVVAAVANGTMEIGATYGRFDDQMLVRAPHAPESVKVCAIAGFVPSDSLLVRTPLLGWLGKRLGDALASFGADELRPLYERLGVEGFAAVDASHLAPLSQLSHLAMRAVQSTSLQRHIPIAG